MADSLSAKYIFCLCSTLPFSLFAIMYTGGEWMAASEDTYPFYELFFPASSCMVFSNCTFTAS